LRFLKEAGIDPRTVETKINPGGSGHDWVKTQFVGEVANLSRFIEGRGVLGLLDEDGQGVEVRKRQVVELLQTQNLPLIDPNQGRCLLLPTRNLETWLYWLTARRDGISVNMDEVTNYKTQAPFGISRIEDKHCRPAGEYLQTLNHTRLPTDCPPILAQSLGHLRTFLNAVRR
jgi:hypothetical protein